MQRTLCSLHLTQISQLLIFYLNFWSPFLSFYTCTWKHTHLFLTWWLCPKQGSLLLHYHCTAHPITGGQHGYNSTHRTIHLPLSDFSKSSDSVCGPGSYLGNCIAFSYHISFLSSNLQPFLSPFPHGSWPWHYIGWPSTWVCPVCPYDPLRLCAVGREPQAWCWAPPGASHWDVHDDDPSYHGDGN